MIPTSGIDWLRHGETRGGNRFRGRTDDPLTVEGWRQMWAAVASDPRRSSATPMTDGRGSYLHPAAPAGHQGPRRPVDCHSPHSPFVRPVEHQDPRRQWDRIIASPLIRCADFARALSQHLDLPLSLDPRLVELDFGAWEGRSAVELMETDALALGQFWADPIAHPPPGGESLPAFQARVLAAWRDLTEQALTAGERLLVISHGGVIRVILCALSDHPLGRLMELEVGHANLTRIRLDQTATGLRALRLDADFHANCHEGARHTPEDERLCREFHANAES